MRLILVPSRGPDNALQGADRATRRLARRSQVGKPDEHAGHAVATVGMVKLAIELIELTSSGDQALLRLGERGNGVHVAAPPAR